jgi:hypothetical protein
MGNQISVNVNDLLESKLPDYTPTSFRTSLLLMRKHRPPFTQMTVNQMVMDPRINFGLWLIKGPILAKAKIEITSDSNEVKEFLDRAVNRFWQNGAAEALKAIEWGYSGSEVLYRADEKTGQIIYDSMKGFEPPNVRVVTKNGHRTGIMVSNYLTSAMDPGKAIYLGGPKCFHHVHWRHRHPYYGLSRLFAASIPWNEIWCDGGFRDIRRLWFFQNAFNGGVIYHPNQSYNLPDGQIIHAQDLAQQMVEQMRSGGVMSFPNTTNAQGQRDWEYVPARGNTIPAGLFDYGDSLRIEILEAMGIPYEVIESSGNEGFGSSSGRKIPETAFYAILQEELNWLLYDLCEQILKPLVQINAALGLLPYDTFEANAHPLDSEAESLDYGDGDETPPKEGEGGKSKEKNGRDPKNKGTQPEKGDSTRGNDGMIEKPEENEGSNKNIRVAA